MQFTIGKETLYLRFIKDDTFSLFSFFGSFPSFFVGNIIFRWSPLASHAACCLHQDKKLTFCCKINHSFSNFLFISAPLSLSFSLSLWYPFPYCVSLLSFFMWMSLYFFSVFFFILYHNCLSSNLFHLFSMLSVSLSFSLANVWMSLILCSLSLCEHLSILLMCLLFFLNHYSLSSNLHLLLSRSHGNLLISFSSINIFMWTSLSFVWVYGRLGSRVIFALNFWTSVCYALGREVNPWWQLFFFGSSITSMLIFQRRRSEGSRKTIINTIIW